MSKEIVTWFKCEEFGDVTIVSGDGQKFRFYKGILSARSDVFRAMFSHDMVESQTNNVTIERFSSDVIGSLLLYIYNDEVGDIGGYVHSLYEAAHQYQLEPLKSICEAVLIRQLSSESIAASLCLAIRLEVKKLAENCVEFLNRYNHRLPVARLLHEASVLSQRIQHDSRQADSESL